MKRPFGVGNKIIIDKADLVIQNGKIIKARRMADLDEFYEQLMELFATYEIRCGEVYVGPYIPEEEEVPPWL